MPTSEPAQPAKKENLSPVAVAVIVVGGITALWAFNGMQTREDAIKAFQQSCTGTAFNCACTVDRVRRTTGFADYAVGGRMLDEETFGIVFRTALGQCVQSGY